MNGKLVIFEGIDGVGKTSLSKQIVENLNTLGFPSEWFSFPGRGNSPFGELIYDLHHNKSKYGIESLNPFTLQLLHVAAHVSFPKNRTV